MGKRNLIIIGPPAAGKGTMSRLINEHFGIPTLSTGDILREEIKKGTELGNLAKSLIDNGNFVPDDVVVKIVANSMKGLKDGYLLDGFPRNIAQAEIFDDILLQSGKFLDAVLYLKIDDKILIDRVSKRLVCPKCGYSYHKENIVPKVKWICDICGISLEQRKDDKPNTMLKRLEIYHESTSPLVEYYLNKGILYTIDSDCSVEEQYGQVRKVLENIR